MTTTILSPDSEPPDYSDPEGGDGDGGDVDGPGGDGGRRIQTGARARRG